MALTLKTGAGAASVRGIRPEMVLAAVIIHGLFPDAMITAGTDGKHMAGSLHYVGLALDLRKPAAPDAIAQLQAALGAEFDVVLEADHIHVEFQPKQPL